MFSALGNATRCAIIDELTEENGLTLFALCTRLHARGIDSSRQAITQHLGILEEARLVSSRREGRYRLHHVDLAPLREAVARWPSA